MIDAAVSTAVNGWRLALTGRFRLLDQWCAFVQVNIFLHNEHLYHIGAFRINQFLSIYLAHLLNTWICMKMQLVLPCDCNCAVWLCRYISDMPYQKILGGKCLNLAVASMKILATTIQKVSSFLCFQGMLHSVMFWALPMASVQHHR